MLVWGPFYGIKRSCKRVPLDQHALKLGAWYGIKGSEELKLSANIALPLGGAHKPANRIP